MGSVTAIFTAENRIHPAALNVLNEAFSQGWADSTKIHHPSRTLAALLAQATATFARLLGVPPESIAMTGEPALGFHLGINGLTDSGVTYLPATSRQEVFAACSQRPTSILPVNLDGGWIAPHGASDDLLITPTVNLETGARASDSQNFAGRIFVDATADPFAPLPQNWSTALWDSTSWQGPRGVGILAISNPAQWRNPLPHNDHRVVPGGVNPALVIATAIALEAFHDDYTREIDRITTLHERIRAFLQQEIGDVDIASPMAPIHGTPHLLSFSFLYVQAEQLVQQMERLGFAVDSGSACISSNLEPSHVLAAMGRLTHGNIRIRLYPQTTNDDVERLLHALKESVERQRATQ